MREAQYMTIPKLASLLGVSRIAVYQRVKKGQIPAVKVGRTYLITDSTVADVLGGKTSEKAKQQIQAAVHRTVQEYGDVLVRLGRE